ncbi:MAG: hypothetical protein M1816_007016 [Peltula sp. TS41687]|nr:MAG: hypothetical protein M1816_007016 [Peltula sp. TS41687]
MVAVSSFLPLAVTCLATVAAAVPAGLTGSKASPSFPTLAELNAKLVLSTKWYENNHTDWKAGNSSLTKRTADPIVNPTCLHDNNYGVAAITWSYYAHNFCMNWGAHSAFGASGRQIYVGYVDLRDILQQGLVVNFGLTFVPMATHGGLRRNLLSL